MDYTGLEFGKEGGAEYARFFVNSHFDADRIFDCGQCFRFGRIISADGYPEWGGVAFGRYISVRQTGREVTLFGTGGEDFFGIWEKYLGLDADYGEINRDILSRSDNPALAEAVACEDGIRILAQDPWETLCSFIISQNNNIPRIKHLTEALCESAGSPFDPGGMRSHGAPEVCYSFPDPEAVSRLGIDKLREMKTGFRAGYIQGAAQDISSGRLMLGAVASAPSTADAASMLVRLRGVGPKVAACTLLFGFGRLDAFPVDVWVKRVIAKYFGDGFRAEELGSYAGIAQQYLFRHERGF